MIPIHQKRPLARLALSIALLAGCGKAHSAPETMTSTTTAPAESAASAHSSAPAPEPSQSAAPTVVPATMAVAPSGSAASAEPPPCPAEMVKVGRVCVDLYEAHLVSLAEGGDEAIFPHYQRPEKGARYEARSSADVFPQAYISRVESAAACKSAGKRLCSRSEWIRACEGPRHYLYPYGHKAKAGSCNSGKLHLLPQLFGDNARAWKYDETFNSPLLNQEPGYLAKAGAYAGCASAVGVLDLVGNLHEWVSDTVDEELVAKLDTEKVERRKQPWQPGNGIFMGGFFSTTNELGAGCYYTTIAHEPAYHDYSTGFRCCKDAPRPAAPR